MINILDAIINIIQCSNYSIKNLYLGRNSINNIGQALEVYIKDAFANCLNITNQAEKNKKYNHNFSWLGNQNNPPDIIIKNSDAIEIKKIQSESSDLALNSSYPKNVIKSTDPMITKACRNCEQWTKKDIIYCVGNTTDNKIKSIWMVYGSIYAAKQEIYQKIKQKIKLGINTIPAIQFSETKELGRVNYVDPLGITNLRIRGMWTITNPKKVFSYLIQNHYSANIFELVAIIPTVKYDNFPLNSKNKLNNLLSSKDVLVKDPNNPANLIKAKLIMFKID